MVFTVDINDNGIQINSNGIPIITLESNDNNLHVKSANNKDVASFNYEGKTTLNLSDDQKAKLFDKITTADESKSQYRVAGRIVYNTETDKFRFFNGSEWKNM